MDTKIARKFLKMSQIRPEGHLPPAFSGLVWFQISATGTEIWTGGSETSHLTPWGVKVDGWDILGEGRVWARLHREPSAARKRRWAAEEAAKAAALEARAAALEAKRQRDAEAAEKEEASRLRISVRELRRRREQQRLATK